MIARRRSVRSRWRSMRPVVVKAVEDGDEIGHVDAEQFDECLLRGRSALAQVLQRVQLAWAQPQRLDCLLDPPAHPSGELRDQHARCCSGASLGAGRAHAMSLEFTNRAVVIYK